jgi:hypothetical protein
MNEDELRQAAVNLYKAFYESCTTTPYDPDKNLADYLAWRAAHGQLSEQEQGRALEAYMDYIIAQAGIVLT